MESCRLFWFMDHLAKRLDGTFDSYKQQEDSLRIANREETQGGALSSDDGSN